MGHLQQRQVKRVVVESREAGENGDQARIDSQEGFVMCLLGLLESSTMSLEIINGIRQQY